MKHIKRLILLIAIVIIILLLILIINYGEKAEYPQSDGEKEPTMEEIYEKKTIGPVTSPTNYYTVVSCIDTYLHDISSAAPREISMSDQEEATMTEEQRKSRIYDELSKEYIEEHNITIENVREYVHRTENYLTFYPISMNVYTNGANLMVSNYGAYGRLRDFKTGEFIGDMYIAVTLDANNMTFAVKPYIESDIKSVDDLNLETAIKQIEKNENNKFSYETVDTETLIKKYISTYKMYALYNPDIAYEYLDEEYKNKRFGSLESFEKYVNNNRQEISQIKIDKYQTIEQDDYRQYVCIDTNGNYYIFNEVSVMDFKVMLDTYTITTEKFIKTYNSSDDQYKVAMNIDKWVQMLNNRDYQAAFKVLDETFRTNNFGNDVDQFEEYMRKYFPEHYKLELGEFSEETGTYMQEIMLKDITGQDEKDISKTIYMELGEGTNFVMSFNLTRH